MTNCEDFPACGHEAGDCDGSLYGSDESIIASVHTAWNTGHGYCDHAEGIYECQDPGFDEDDEDFEPGSPEESSWPGDYQEDIIIDAGEP